MNINKKIFCSFFKKELDSLNYPPYPGKIGLKIYNEISKAAWKQWTNQQTKLINEKKLNMLNILDQKKLEQKMCIFLFKKNLKTELLK